MSKKRPGVEAAKRLAESSDVVLWEQVESQLEAVVKSVDKLEELNDNCQIMGKQLQEEGNKSCINKEELLEKIIPWKFSVGKPRHALMKLLSANSEKDVQKHSKFAREQARDIVISKKNPYPEKELKSALEELTNLKGVGPATASAILTLVRPDLFCYMYDEAIDCFLPKRTYTMPAYIKVNEECTRIAETLKDWTTSRVSQTLWVAARVCASGSLNDHTLKKKKPPSSGKRPSSEETTSTSKTNKRRRRR